MQTEARVVPMSRARSFATGQRQPEETHELEPLLKACARGDEAAWAWIMVRFGGCIREEGITGFNAISWSVVLDIQEDGGRADEDDDRAIRAVLDALRQAERVTLHIDVEPRRAASANRAQRLSITRGRTAQDRSRYSAPTD